MAMKIRAISGCLPALAATLLVLTVGGAPSRAQVQAWRNATNGSAPSASDVSECRIEGRRQAEQMYPMRPPPGLPQGTMSDDSDRRNGVERNVFNQCMRRKGYELVDQK